MPNGKRWPRISIVTPSFNQGRYLEETIRSVLLQGYPNLEYIIMDGGSTDNSIDIIRRYARHLSHWQSGQDGGQSSAIQEGFKRSSGSIINWLNSDDILYPNALKHVALQFCRSGIVAVYGNRKEIDLHSQVTNEFFPPPFLTKGMWLLGQPIPQEATFISREAYKSVGGIDDTLFFCMDYSLYVRLFSLGRFKKIRQFLGAIRNHADTKSRNHEVTMWKEFHKIKTDFGLHRPRPMEARLQLEFRNFQQRLEKFLSKL